MKTKFIALSLIVAGICITSCRQDDENPAEETFQSSLKENSTEESQRVGKDSISIESLETDPPRDGAHWKVDEIIETVKTDSTLIPKFNLDNGPKDPPKESSHWKESN